MSKSMMRVVLALGLMTSLAACGGDETVGGPSVVATDTTEDAGVGDIGGGSDAGGELDGATADSAGGEDVPTALDVGGGDTGFTGDTSGGDDTSGGEDTAGGDDTAAEDTSGEDTASSDTASEDTMGGDTAGGDAADGGGPECTENADCVGKINLEACFAAICKNDKCTVGLAPEGSSCDDGDACTDGETCALGKCGGGKNACGCKDDAACDDKNPCTKDTCGSDGKCAYTPAAGAKCDDGDACKIDTTCQADGTCGGGKAKECDDGDICTDDACEKGSGCVNNDNTAECDDGDACTGKSACKGGKCVGSEPKKCDDGEICTDDSCDKVKGCVSQANTAKCDDGDSCTSGDTCKAGKCAGSVAGSKCDDNDPCTVDTCDKAKGCVSTPAKDGSACDDGNACTDKDACKGGKCGGGSKKVCDDGKPCTDDGCDAKTGCTTKNNTAKCADDKTCTAGTCKDGQCALGNTKGCNDNNPCTTDTCDAAKGCVYKPAADGSKCDDGDACTDSPVCTGGKCGGKPTDCDDGNACTTDTCDPAKGCSWVANTANCDDGNKCTTGDKCGGGKCAGTPSADPAKLCTDNNSCTTDTCDPKTGCVHTPKKPAKPCDGTLVGDRCYKAFTGTMNSGNALNQCKSWGGSLVSIADKDEDALAYKLMQGTCGTNTSGAHIGGRDTAQEGTWFWLDGTPWGYTNWDSGQPSNSGGGGGQDYLMLRPNGKWNDLAGNNNLGCRICERVMPKILCDDGSKCTKNEHCDAKGQCTGGTNDGCDDGKPCTTDNCDAKTGACSWSGKSGPCDDGDKCSSGEVCKAGKCTGGTAVVCNDKNPCTVDKCDPATGKCVFTHASLACDDGDGCTAPDACSAGKCVGVVKDCSDGDPCTADSCDKASGKCVFTKIAGCQGCKVAADCDDGNPCTTNTCDASSGKCAKANNTNTCDNGDPCTYGDKCDGKGTCVTGKNNACDDDNPCTTDSCDKAKGCVNAAAKDGASCSDGKACTTGDSCKAGQCVAGKDDCDLYVNTFDCGSSTVGWSLSSTGGNPPLRWNFDNTADVALPGKGCNLNYNDGTDYCRPWFNGQCYTPDESAYSPVINATQATGTPRLSFWTYYDVDAPANTDIPRVRVYSGNTVLYTFNLSKAAANMKTWRKIDVAVPNIKGKNNIRIRFYLTSASGQGGNAGKGWFIDDLRLTKSGNQIPESCTDGKDNDGDNKVDCADSDCKTEAACIESCTDGKDNDLDDQVDCKDTDCATAPNCLCAVADCDDKNPCTNDTCDDSTGKCVHTPNQLLCDDGNPCTSGDTCGAGKCVGAAKSCSDGDPCTADSCDKATGKCTNTAIAGCGGCKSNADCSDGNSCTNDVCDTKTGKCSAVNNTSACDSGDPCSFGDVCDGKGSCKAGSGKTCDDGNSCTVDTCDAKTGKCAYNNAKDGATCDDGKACTTGDACKAGACTPTKTDCPLFKYTFDCGSSTSGFNLQSTGGNPVLRWAVDATPKIESPKGSGASGGCNLNYNDGTDYCRPWGGSNCYTPDESAYTPVFSAVGVTGTPKVEFWTYYDLDSPGSNNTDRPRVLVYGGNQVIHSYYLSKASSSMKKWYKVSLNIPNIKGRNNVRLRFLLNPASGQGGNKGAGWFIDDLVVTSPGSAGPELKEICGDGKDNDGNKLTDCADPACKAEASCKESCGDGKDNDLDDKIDCADPDCSGALNCSAPFFEQGMACGASGWGFSKAKNGVAFAIDATPGSVTPKSGGCTLNFNNGKNFCGVSTCSQSTVNNRTAGDATWTKDIDATGLKSLTAEYWSYQHGQEPVGNGVFLDVGFLQASTNNFQGCCNADNTSCAWSAVNCNTSGTKSFLAPKTTSAWKTWTKVTVDLKDFVGKKFKLRFRFSSQGSQANDLPGWFIDDLKLFGAK